MVAFLFDLSRILVLTVVVLCLLHCIILASYASDLNIIPIFENKPRRKTIPGFIFVISLIYEIWIYNYLCNQCLSPVTSNVHIHGDVYSIQHCVIKCVSNLRQVSCFLRVPRFPSQNKFDRLNIAEMLLNVALSTITASPIPFIGLNVETGIHWEQTKVYEKQHILKITPILYYTNFIVCVYN